MHFSWTHLGSAGLILHLVACGGDAFVAGDQNAGGTNTGGTSTAGASAGAQAGEGGINSGGSSSTTGGASGQAGGENTGGASGAQAGGTAGNGGDTSGAGGAPGGSSGAGEGGTSGQGGGNAGESGTAGTEGGEGGSAGSGGPAGEGGTSGGESGTSGGGTGGNPGCVGPSSCPASPDLCSRSVCTEGVCGFEVDPIYAPPQTDHDCKARICQDGKTVLIDDNDPPSPQGECDVVTCDKGAPVHTPSNELCPTGKVCKVAQCVCAPCPVGELPNGAPQECQLLGLATASASDDVPVTGPVGNIVDGKLETAWESTFFPFFGVGKATLAIQPKNPTTMAAIILHPKFKGLGLYEGDPSLQIHVVVRDADNNAAYVTDQFIAPENANKPLELVLPGIKQVKRIELDVTAYDSSAGFYEISFRTCLP